MSMNSNGSIEKKFKTLLKIKNDNEKIQLKAEMLHLDIMNEISQLMEKKSISKTQLADKLNVSKSYITQLFTGDKLINLKLLSQIQVIFDVSFTIQPKDNFKKYGSFDSKKIVKLFRKPKMEFMDPDEHNEFKKYEYKRQTILDQQISAS